MFIKNVSNKFTNFDYQPEWFAKLQNMSFFFVHSYDIKLLVSLPRPSRP